MHRDAPEMQSGCTAGVVESTVELEESSART